VPRKPRQRLFHAAVAGLHIITELEFEMTLGAMITGVELGKVIVKTFLTTEFSGIEMIADHSLFGYFGEP
jgi:hypothetical protein